MCTAHSSSRPGGGGLHQAPPGADPPDKAPPSLPGSRPPQDQAPLVNRMTDRCKNITLPQASFAGGNNYQKDMM